MIHVVDHLTQCSACCVIQSKRIAIFGSPKIFLVGNGGEFDNSEFVSFCENFNINIKTTVVESHWSSGLVEFHNGVLGNTEKDDEWQTKLFSGNWCCLGYSSQDLPEKCVWIFSKSTSFHQSLIKNWDKLFAIKLRQVLR